MASHGMAADYQSCNSQLLSQHFAATMHLLKQTTRHMKRSEWQHVMYTWLQVNVRHAL